MTFLPFVVHGPVMAVSAFLTMFARTLLPVDLKMEYARLGFLFLARAPVESRIKRRGSSHDRADSIERSSGRGGGV